MSNTSLALSIKLIYFFLRFAAEASAEDVTVAAVGVKPTVGVAEPLMLPGVPGAENDSDALRFCVAFCCIAFVKIPADNVLLPVAVVLVLLQLPEMLFVPAFAPLFGTIIVLTTPIPGPLVPATPILPTTPTMPVVDVTFVPVMPMPPKVFAGAFTFPPAAARFFFSSFSFSSYSRSTSVMSVLQRRWSSCAVRAFINQLKRNCGANLQTRCDNVLIRMRVQATIR